MIYEGHLSHVEYITLCHRRQHKVTILKRPAHTTDTLHLQSLD